MDQIDKEIIYSLSVPFVLLVLLCIYGIINCTDNSTNITTIQVISPNQEEEIYGDL
jgi:hypothetical protein